MQLPCTAQQLCSLLILMAAQGTKLMTPAKAKAIWAIYVYALQDAVHAAASLCMLLQRSPVHMCRAPWVGVQVVQTHR